MKSDRNSRSNVKFIATTVYIKKNGTEQNNKWTSHLKNLKNLSRS